jgi:23S rRNA (cytosine1962-C5)-methyltransferase
MTVDGIENLLERALAARVDLMDENHTGALRLFNGFLEGSPDLVIDLYARTLVVFDYEDDPFSTGRPLVDTAWRYVLELLPWLQAVILKNRGGFEEERRGRLVYGQSPDRKVQEHGVWYAVDMMLNLDASFYLDTRNLRRWAIDHLAGKRVLNCFAYTGSLGVAAQAGGAAQVIQMDLNRRFLNLAKDSCVLNGFPVRKADYRTVDFWVQANQYKRAGELFDCIFVDPPFFSTTSHGTVDLVTQSHRVINKVRPLVGHNGWLVAINNALFLSGADYLAMLEQLCADGYVSIEELISVPPDLTGYPETRSGQLPADPAPFNYSTKIAVLHVTRKDERTALVR